MAVTPRLPKDVNGTEVQSLSLASVSTIATVGVASASTALPTGATPGSVIRVACTVDCHIAFGASGVTAANTDHLFTPGVEVMVVPDSATHIAAIRVSADGTLSCTLML